MSDVYPIPTNKQFFNLANRVYGRLTVESYAGKSGSGISLWNCRCKCERQTIVMVSSLTTGRSRSCGCLRMEVSSVCHTIHGCALRTVEYTSWASMIQRCTNPNSKKFKSYGGRGIRICERWLASFDNFLADMGPKPSKRHTIDRIENNGNYEPSNCRWATPKEQARNSRRNRLLTHKGETMCVSAWAERLGVKPYVLFGRIYAGWSTDAILT